MAMGTLADLEDQEPIPGKDNPINIHLQVGLLSISLPVVSPPAVLECKPQSPTSIDLKFWASSAALVILWAMLLCDPPGRHFCSEALQQRAHLPLHVPGGLPLQTPQREGGSEGLGWRSAGHAGVRSLWLHGREELARGF